jgi:hypothetical protein
VSGFKIIFDAPKNITRRSKYRFLPLQTLVEEAVSAAETAEACAKSFGWSIFWHYSGMVHNKV